MRAFFGPFVLEIGAGLRGARVLQGELKVIYLKATVVGLVSALLFAGVWSFAFIRTWMRWQLREARHDGGVIGSTTFIGSSSFLIVALVGFVVGFLWFMRRSR